MCHKTELVFRLHLVDTLTLIKCMEATENRKKTQRNPGRIEKVSENSEWIEKTQRIERDGAHGRVKTS